MQFFSSIFYYPILTTVSMETPSIPALLQLLVLIGFQEVTTYQYRITRQGIS